jgi:hypothetical protein
MSNCRESNYREYFLKEHYKQVVYWPVLIIVKGGQGLKLGEIFGNVGNSTIGIIYEVHPLGRR